MTAQHSKSIALRFLAVLALLAGFAGGAAQPASADASQWQMSQPHWWDNSNGWRRHHQWSSQQWANQQWPNQQWPNQHWSGHQWSGHQWSGHQWSSQQWPSQWHRHNQFNNGFHRCFGSCFGSQVIIRGNRVFIISPALVANPAFIVQQPPFIIQQPAFIVRQPAFIIGGQGLIIRQNAKQRAFFEHHRSLQMGGAGIRFIRPGMMD
jgi:hypothetical protein